MNTDLYHSANAYMQRAISLAFLGKYSTAPNPMVGAVLVYNGRIIGEGYHEQYGGPHAEVNCIHSVSQDDKSLIKDAILFVTLEPCSHYGKTPPCADFIIRHEIKKVVVGMLDPNPSVYGRGVALLRAHDIDVIVGVLEDEIRNMNKHFITNQVKKRPYITLKWAMTQDGYIGTGQHHRLMVSNTLTQRFVHKVRAEHQAIAVGVNTALLDSPRLDTRYYPFSHPLRIIFYQSDNSYNTLAGMPEYREGWRMVRLDERFIAEGFSLYMEQDRVGSILIEGGKKILDFFIANNLWDEAIIIRADGRMYGNDVGVGAPNISGKIIDRFMLYHDTIEIRRPV